MIYNFPASQPEKAIVLRTPNFNVSASDFPPVVWNSGAPKFNKSSELKLGGRQAINAATISLAAPAASLSFAEPAEAPAFSTAAPTAEAA